MCAGAGAGRVPESSGGFHRVLEGFRGFQSFPEGSGVTSRRFKCDIQVGFRKVQAWRLLWVPQGSDVTATFGSARFWFDIQKLGCGRFRCGVQSGFWKVLVWHAKWVCKVGPEGSGVASKLGSGGSRCDIQVGFGNVMGSSGAWLHSAV